MQHQKTIPGSIERDENVNSFTTNTTDGHETHKKGININVPKVKLDLVLQSALRC